MSPPATHRLLPPALLALAVACGDRPSPTAIEDPAPPLQPVKLPHDPDHPLEVKAGVHVEPIDAETIREHVEIAAFFTVDPLDPDPQTPPVEDLTLAFGTMTFNYAVSTPGGAFSEEANGSWKIEERDPQAVPAVINFVAVEDGHVVDDLTPQIAAVEARLEPHPDAKGWVLTVELTGIGTAPMFHPILGATTTSLAVGQDQVAMAIREGESEFVSGELQARVGAKVEEVDGGMVHEHVETTYVLTGLDPFDRTAQPPTPRDLLIRLDLQAAGDINFIRFIPGVAWSTIDGGQTWTFEAADPQAIPAVIQILLEEDGQVPADLTGHIASVKAQLVEFDQNAKAPVLTVELAGIATPTMDFAPKFSPMVGAATVSLDGGESLVASQIREGEAAFF